MRLFTAILFDEEIKDSLYETVEKLHIKSKGGSFTTKDNLHLTVNFIGETKRLEEVKLAMSQAVSKTKAGSFSLSIRGFGKFKRNEGDIYWIGVERENTLWRLQKELTKELKEAGFFDIDDREYKPHLTLGRRVRVPSDFSEKDFEADLTPMKMEVKKISLMKSERVEGKLVYTEIYHVAL
jgi:2'-5' RNA ligase